MISNQTCATGYLCTTDIGFNGHVEVDGIYPQLSIIQLHVSLSYYLSFGIAFLLLFGIPSNFRHYTNETNKN